MIELRNKKFGGSVKESEYKIFVETAKRLNISITELIVRAVTEYSAKESIKIIKKKKP